MTIIYWTASWLSGIWLASNEQIPWFFWLIPCAVGILCAILLRRTPIFRMISICVAIGCLGAIRYSQTVLPKADNHISNFNGVGDITVTGLIADEPDVRDTTTNLLVEVESLSTVDGNALPVFGQVLVRVPRYPAIAYGSRLQMSGNLKEPVNRSDFDYQQYLARRNIYSEMNRPDIVFLETGGGNPIFKLMLAIKARAQDTINRLFPEPHAALLDGILLDYDRGLPKEYDTLIKKAEDLQIPIHRALAGEVIELDSEARLEILHPDPNLDPDRDNDNSVTMRLVYGDFSLLLTGDAEGKAVRKMLAAGRPLQSLVYKAGHHGANTSSSAIFLNAIQPQYVVISAGESNRFGHPHEEALQRFEEIGVHTLRTDEIGTIELNTDGQGFWWETNR